MRAPARAALAVRGLSAKRHSGQTALFHQTYGPAPILGQLLELRATADYGREELIASPEQLRALVVVAEAFVERCRGIVDEALARGSDEPDPPPDS